MEKVSLRSEELKHSWDSTNMRFERDRSYDLSWPQRNYSCSFCKKQFKSAQALGGHMNVHRRDRARLRQSTPPQDCPNSNPSPILPTSIPPNPNPSFSSSPSAARFFPYISYYSSLTSSLSSNPSAASAAVLKDHCDDSNNGGFYEVGRLKSSMKKEDPPTRVLKKKNEASVVRYGYNMGLVKDVQEEGVDLELRLGYS